MDGHGESRSHPRNEIFRATIRACSECKSNRPIIRCTVVFSSCYTFYRLSMRGKKNKYRQTNNIGAIRQNIFLSVSDCADFKITKRITELRLRRKLFAENKNSRQNVMFFLKEKNRYKNKIGVIGIFLDMIFPHTNFAKSVRP